MGSTRDFRFSSDLRREPQPSPKVRTQALERGMIVAYEECPAMVGSQQSQKKSPQDIRSTCPKKNIMENMGHPIAQTDGSQIFLVELIKDYTQLPVAYLDDHSFKAISESIFPPFSSISKGK